MNVLPKFRVQLTKYEGKVFAKLFEQQNGEYTQIGNCSRPYGKHVEVFKKSAKWCEDYNCVLENLINEGE